MDIFNTLQTFILQVFQLPTLPLDATESRPRVWAAVLGGAGLGLGWGIAARAWMRLISTSPEFSIEGTAAILIITTLFGTCAGLALAARRRGWRRWGHYGPRVLAVFFFIPFGMAGGAPLMLTVLLAVLAVTQATVFGVWVVVPLAMVLVLMDTDGNALMVVAALVSVVLLASQLATRWPGGPRWVWVNAWLERIVRGVLLLIAVGAIGDVAQEISRGKPWWLATVSILLYLVLLYPLFLALRIGLQPKASSN